MGVPLRLLLVEDSDDDASLLLRELRRGGYDTEHERVQSSAEMIAALDHATWDLVIADYALPRFSGMDALSLLKDRGIDLPFIVVSGTIGEEVAVAAMKAGAHDYVMKNNLTRLVPAISRELRDAAERRERRKAEERLQHSSLYDALTNLPNRALFMDRLGLALGRAQRHGDFRFAVLFIDIDRFKVVIDSLGHLAGDHLLVAFARLLERCVRPGDTVARLGGDEFAILLDDIRNVADPTLVAERIRNQYSRPFHLQETPAAPAPATAAAPATVSPEVYLTASIGIALSDSGYDRPDDILRDANTAMHRAKALGKARHEVFDPAMHDRAVKLLRMETDMRRALERREFRVHYQPIVSLKTGRLAGFEALARWAHPERGLVMPDEFISVAEDNGLILPLGEWVLNESCRQMQEWRKRFPATADLTIGVNLSAKQLAQPDLDARVGQALKETGLEALRLHLEITESMIMQDAEAAIAMLQRLKALGLRLHIDDFGTGYSSLSHLHRFPIDTLKIDRSFVTRMGANHENLEIVRTIVLLAHTMRQDVIAEGVETAVQRAQLQALECEFGQGYLFARPMDADAATALLASPPQW